MNCSLNKRLLSAGVLLFLLYSCVDPGRRDALCRTWQYDLLATRQELHKRQADDLTMELMETWMLEKQFSELVFDRNGSFQMRWRDLLTSGTWRFRRGGKHLQIIIGEKKQLLSIDRISPDSLILTPLTEEADFTRVLVVKNS